MTEPLTVAWLGTGLMGAPMTANLLKNGHMVRVYNRTRAKAEPLAAQGAIVCATPAEAAQGCSIVFITVTDGPDVETVLGGKSGALQNMTAGSMCVDMSTIAPAKSREIAAQCAQHGVKFLEAPVTGGTVGAQNGTLSIMVGGDQADYEHVQPLLNLLGGTLTYCGPHGAAQTVKLCNQICGALNLLGVCEALLLGQKMGVDPDLIVRVVSGGAARSWAMEVLAPKILAGDFAPGFMIETQQKDMRLVNEAAEASQTPLPGATLAQQLWRAAQAQGWDTEGTQAMFKVLQGMAGVGLE